MTAEFKIIYEDNMLLVADKPAGLLSQGDRSGADNLLDLLKAYLKRKHRKAGNVFLGLVHRLDRNTSGVICYAKNSKAAARLSEQFRANTVERIYHVMVGGKPPHDAGTLTDYLEKDEERNIVKTAQAGKKAVLEYKVIERLKDAALLEIRIHTGRPHQIRVQLAHAGMPVIGDQKYGTASPRIGRPAVHARSLTLRHPVSKEILRLEAPVPRDMTVFISRG